MEYTYIDTIAKILVINVSSAISFTLLCVQYDTAEDDLGVKEIYCGRARFFSHSNWYLATDMWILYYSFLEVLISHIKLAYATFVPYGNFPFGMKNMVSVPGT